MAPPNGNKSSNGVESFPIKNQVQFYCPSGRRSSEGAVGKGYLGRRYLCFFRLRLAVSLSYCGNGAGEGKLLSIGVSFSLLSSWYIQVRLVKWFKRWN